MSKFNNIVKEALGNTNLTKIQIKTDPAQDIDSLSSMSQAKSYTGYLLEEDPMNPIVIPLGDMIGQDSPINVSPMDMQVDPVEELKHEGILYLLQKGLINRKDGDKIQEILACQTVQELETALRDYNITDTEILSLYRDYFKPNQCQCHDNSGI